MFLPVENLENVISAYLDTEVMPKADSLQKFMTAVVGVTLTKNITQIVEKNRNFLEIAGLVKEEGIPIEDVYTLLTDALDKAGGKVQVLGLVFDQSDIDAIHNIALQHTQ